MQSEARDRFYTETDMCVKFAYINRIWADIAMPGKFEYRDRKTDLRQQYDHASKRIRVIRTTRNSVK